MTLLPLIAPPRSVRWSARPTAAALFVLVGLLLMPPAKALTPDAAAIRQMPAWLPMAIQWRPTSPPAPLANNAFDQSVYQARAEWQQGRVPQALWAYQHAIDQAHSLPQWIPLVHELTALGAYRLADVAGERMLQTTPALTEVWPLWRQHTFPATMPSRQEELKALEQRARSSAPAMSLNTPAPESAPLVIGSFNQADRLLPSDAPLLRQALEQLHQRQFDSAIALLGRQIRLETHQALTYSLLTRAYWATRQWVPAQAALSFCVKWASKQPDPALPPWLAQETTYWLAEGWLEPIRPFQTLLPEPMRLPPALAQEWTGRTALLTRHHPVAFDALSRSLLLNPTQARAWTALALASPDPATAQQAHRLARQLAGYTDRPYGVETVTWSTVSSALPTATVPTPNEASYWRYLFTQEARYQKASATLYKTLPTISEAKQRHQLLAQAFQAHQHIVTAMAAGYPPDSPGCRQVRQQLLAKGYRQLALIQQLMQPDSSTTLQTEAFKGALRQQATLEQEVIANLPKLSGLAPMTLYQLKLDGGLSMPAEQLASQAMAPLITPADKSAEQNTPVASSSPSQALAAKTSRLGRRG